MKCSFCGANMPDPPPAPTYSESYKELREEIGKLEYDKEVLVQENKNMAQEKVTLAQRRVHVEDLLATCNGRLDHLQESEKVHNRKKNLWKAAAIVLLLTNTIWLCMLMAFAGDAM